MPFSAINMDFEQTKRVAFKSSAWEASPSPGVARIKLERQAAESGHTTSIVRYGPGTSFPRHAHPTGEEFLVLEGVFSDEHGDYPEGTYVRNSPGSSHQPFSHEGCVLLVKLCQMKDEEDRVVLKMEGGLNSQLLFHHPTLLEKVNLERLEPGKKWQERVADGLEILGESVTFECESETTLWIKRGHHGYLPLE